MRILLVSPYDYAYAYSAVLRANSLKNMGHKVEVCDYRKVVKCYGVPIIKKIGIWMMNKKLITIVRKMKPDFILVLKGEIIFGSTLRFITTCLGSKTVNWFPDDPHRLNLSLRLAPSYDYFFTHDTYAMQIQRIASNNFVGYLPFACDPGFHRTIQLSKQDLDKYKSEVCFIGSYNQTREILLKTISDLGLHIWGPGWENSTLTNNVKAAGAYGEEMIKIYNASKIAINIHQNFGQPIECYGFGANSRLFELSGCGVFQLVDRKKDITKLFKENKEIVFYENIRDLRNKTIYFLKNHKERAEIAKNSQRRAYSEHTLEKRLKKLISIVKA